MKCASCKGTHETVAQARTCATARSASNTKSVRARLEPEQPTEGQASLAQALGREKVRPEEHAGKTQLEFEQWIAALSKAEIRPFINTMLQQPNDQGVMGRLFGNAENGKYALHGEEPGQIRYFQISGVHVRKLFELFGSPGEFRQKRIYRPNKILEAIAEDPIAAFELFGKTVGTCGRCGSPLTQEHTRIRGTGDICNDKLQAAHG